MPAPRLCGAAHAGEAAAAGPLWQAYFGRLVHLARRHLRGLRGAAADEEDVALSAFDSFCRAAEGGRFPRLEDRDDLWQLLLLLTARKAVDLLRRERRQKRGGGLVVSASTLANGGEGADVFAEVLGREPTPELAAQAVEECRRLMGDFWRARPPSRFPGTEARAFEEFLGYGPQRHAAATNLDAVMEYERRLGAAARGIAHPPPPPERELGHLLIALHEGRLPTAE